MPDQMKTLQHLADEAEASPLHSIRLAYDAVTEAAEAGGGEHMRDLSEALIREIEKTPVANLPPPLVGMVAEYRACQKSRSRLVRSQASEVDLRIFYTIRDMFDGENDYWRIGAPHADERW